MLTQKQIEKHIETGNILRDILNFIASYQRDYFKLKTIDNKNKTSFEETVFVRHLSYFSNPFLEDRLMLFSDLNTEDHSYYEYHPDGVKVFGEDESGYYHSYAELIVPYTWIEMYNHSDNSALTKAIENYVDSFIARTIAQLKDDVEKEQQKRLEDVKQKQLEAKQKILEMMGKHNITKEDL